MQYQLMFSLPLLIQFAFDFGLHTCICSIKKYLEAMATQVNFLQNNLTQMDRALRIVNKRVATIRQDAVLDEFVEIDSDQWSD